MNSQRKVIKVFLSSLFVLAAFSQMNAESWVGEPPSKKRKIGELEEASFSTGKNPVLAGLLGLVPGLGEAYVGNYGTAAMQLGLFSGATAWANHFAADPGYIKPQDQYVNYSAKNIAIGYWLRQNGYIYGSNLYSPFGVESSWDRDHRLIQEHQFSETNPLVRYGPYYRFNTTTANAEMTSQFALDMIFYSAYSAYRDAGGVPSRRNETYEDLANAPFRLKNIATPYVLIPLVILGGVSAVSRPSNPTIVNPSMVNNTGYLQFYALSSSFNAGVNEEAFFRGFLNDYGTKTIGPFWSGLGTGTLFGLAHMGTKGNIGNVIPQLLAGYYFAILQYKNGGDIQQNIALHFWWDFIIFLVQVSTFHPDQNVNKTPQQVNFMPLTYTMRF